MRLFYSCRNGAELYQNCTNWNNYQHSFKSEIGIQISKSMLTKLQQWIEMKVVDEIKLQYITLLLMVDFVVILSVLFEYVSQMTAC